MIKYLDYYPGDEGVEIKLVHPGVLEKTAEYDRELKEYLSNLKPNPDRYYLLINALGAGEYYGPNRNGDFFSEKALQEYHKTFEALAKVFRHHKNKPRLGHRIYGEVMYSHYNSTMHRVELVIALDIKAAPDLKRQLDKGEFPPVSMGSRVPFDVCSICGNKAPKIADYCDHAKYMMNKVMSDGRKVFVYNPNPKFFDISFVHVPADRTAYTLKKVASVTDVTVVPSAVKTAEELKDAGIKEADITKIIDGKVEAASSDPSKLIAETQPDMPKDMMDEMCSSAPLNEVLSTLLAMRIMPKRRDFQRLILQGSGRGDLADDYERNKVVFVVRDEAQQQQMPDDVGYQYLNNDVVKIIRDRPRFLDRAPLTKPVVMLRIMEKRAQLDGMHQSGSDMEQGGIVPPLKEESYDPLLPNLGKRFQYKKPLQADARSPIKNPLLPLATVGGLYYAFAKAMSAAGKARAFDTLLVRNPWLLPILIGAGTLGSMGLQKGMIEKRSSAKINPLAGMMLSVPATYMYAGHQEAQVQKGKPITRYGDFVRKHPLLASLTHGVLSGVALKKFASAPLQSRIANAYFELSEQKFNKLYETIIT